jgi:hypothetical protein
MTDERLSQTERGREPAEGRVDVSQPSDATAQNAEREHERDLDDSTRRPEDRPDAIRADIVRSDLDMNVPNEGLGIEPDESDEELREALREKPPID